MMRTWLHCMSSWPDSLEDSCQSATAAYVKGIAGVPDLVWHTLGDISMGLVWVREGSVLERCVQGGWDGEVVTYCFRLARGI